MEITRPELNSALLATLESLATQIDGTDRESAEHLIAEFNRLAGTDESWENFQDVQASCDHDEHVRSLLASALAEPDSTLCREDLIGAFATISEVPSDDVFLFYAMAVIEKTFSDPAISDLIFWPNQYDPVLGDNPSPEQMADAVLKKYQNSI